MTLKLSTPYSGAPALSADFRNGSFELYKTGTWVRAYAYTEPSLGRAADFQVTLGDDGRPTRSLWVDDPTKYDVVFRTIDGTQIAIGLTKLSDCLSILDSTSPSPKNYEELEWDGNGQCTKYSSGGVIHTVTWTTGQRTRIETDSYIQTLTYPGGNLKVVSTRK